MPVATPLNILGVAKEVSKGVAVTPSNYLPIPKTRIWQDQLHQLDDVASRGAMMGGPFDQIAGALYATYDIPDGPVFADAAPWWLMAIMGDYTSLANRSVADAVTNSTTTVTSATAAFTQNDVGRPITPSADFATGTWIASVTNATTIILNIAALTTGAAKTLAIGAAGLVSHWGSVKNSGDGQPTSLTLTDFYGITGSNSRQFAGCQVSEVILKFSGDGLLTIAPKLVGFGSALVAKPTPAYTTIAATPGWENIVTIGGSSSLILVSGELSLKRVTAPIHSADGTQAPYKIWQGGLDVTGKLVLVGEDDSEYLRYLNHVPPTILYDFRHGAGASFIGTRLSMSKANFKGAVMDHSGDYMRVNADVQALWNATDVGATGGFGPIRIHSQNSVAVGSYQ